MPTRFIDIDDARQHLADLVDEASRGDEVVITRDQMPVAKLVAIGKPGRARRPGSAVGLITMSDDFDEPLEDFADYMR